LFAHSQTNQFFVCTSLVKKLLTIKVSTTKVDRFRYRQIYASYVVAGII